MIVRQFYVRPGSTLIERVMECHEGGTVWREVPPEQVGSISTSSARYIGESQGWCVYQQYLPESPGDGRYVTATNSVTRWSNRLATESALPLTLEILRAEMQSLEQSERRQQLRALREQYLPLEPGTIWIDNEGVDLPPKQEPAPAPEPEPRRRIRM